MTAVSAPRPGWELLAGPGQVNQRRYEALRACLYEGASLQQAAAATGCTRAALASLVRDLRAGKLTVFAPPRVPGRKSAPENYLACARVIEPRPAGLRAPRPAGSQAPRVRPAASPRAQARAEEGRRPGPRHRAAPRGPAG